MKLDYQPGWGDGAEAKMNGYMNGEGPGHRHQLVG